MLKWNRRRAVPDGTQYSQLMLTIHWLTAALVMLAYCTSEGETQVRTHSQTAHVILGLSVLALTMPRILGRVFGAVPAPSGSTKRMSRVIAFGHGGIYLLLVAVPVSGWFAVSRLRLRIKCWGFQLPLLTAPAVGPPRLIGNLHQLGGNLLIIVAALHASLALWHFFWLRDRTLQRMSPWTGSPPES
jgi:cytochrome b561